MAYLTASLQVGEDVTKSHSPGLPRIQPNMSGGAGPTAHRGRGAGERERGERMGGGRGRESAWKLARHPQKSLSD